MLHAITPVLRYSDVDRQKADGVTYTPEELAAFVAEQMLRVADLPENKTVRVLDPAVGDGALLHALIVRLPKNVQDRLDIFGYDTNQEALNRAEKRLKTAFPNLNIFMKKENFIDHVLNLQGYSDLFSTSEAHKRFNLVIANPPYVRTQIMGTQQARQIAQRFGLTGRIDLYYPFLLGISEVLDSKGIAGIITSNRFMTTKSGQSIRRELLSRFRVSHVWDFGDTKLFDAAVLPSVLVAKGTVNMQQPHTVGIIYSSIYETDAPAKIAANDPISALAAEDDTVVSVCDGRHFHVRHGELDNGSDAEGVWRIATKSTDKWLAIVEANTWNTFSRIGKIRVGVKSTADKVFIRSDWNDLPEGRPELLRTLITRHNARRFKAKIPSKTQDIKEILYPHEATETGRCAVDLSRYPNSAHYLERYRNILEARTYVIAAGRRWYELWVPQDPAAWVSPKLVFPDISDKPIFWIDTGGGIVNGECYWLRSESESENDLLWLALAVANSSFIEKFYDHRFNNKLYAGRRRFITQYVELFPLPDPAREDAKTMITMTKEIYAKTPSTEADNLANKLDELVWMAFGVLREEIGR